VLANHCATLVNAAESNQVYLKYDASVGGGIPIAKVIETTFKGDDIVKIAGIFNATSNFIYSKIQYGGMDYAHALKIAQEKGFAENDPSEDIDGIDAKNKLVILSLFGMQKLIQPKYLLTNSFKNIEETDVLLANTLGYQIKPLAIFKAVNSHYEYYIGPCLVDTNHLFAATHNNFNSIILEGTNAGDLGFYGQGAGGRPTATAMFDDLISIIKHRPIETLKPLEQVQKNKLKQLQSRFYFRISNIGKTANENIINSFQKAEMDIEKTISQKEEQIIISAEANTGQIRELMKNISKSGAKVQKTIPIFT
jgi:homoserine dehydrogenase